MKINETTQSLFTIATWITNKLIQTSTDMLNNFDLVWGCFKRVNDQSHFSPLRQSEVLMPFWMTTSIQTADHLSKWVEITGNAINIFAPWPFAPNVFSWKWAPDGSHFFPRKSSRFMLFATKKATKKLWTFCVHQPRHLLTLMVTALRLLAVMSNNISVVCWSSIEKLKNSPNSLHLLFHSIRPTVFKTSLCHVYVTIKLDDNPFRIYDQS